MQYSGWDELDFSIGIHFLSPFLSQVKCSNTPCCYEGFHLKWGKKSQRKGQICNWCANNRLTLTNEKRKNTDMWFRESFMFLSSPESHDWSTRSSLFLLIHSFLSVNSKFKEGKQINLWKRTKQKLAVTQLISFGSQGLSGVSYAGYVMWRYVGQLVWFSDCCSGVCSTLRDYL